jgi:4-hydroxy-tetrahydrodipicolinate synthase
MKTIDSVYCAAVTPMNRQYEIDYGGMRTNIEWYVQEGLGGALICGGTGEFVSLDTAERKELVEFSARQINGRMGFMVGCAAETTKDAVMFARHAESVGADAVLLIASYYFKPSEEELYQHFKTVAESVRIPIVLYNNPGACGSNLSPRLVERLSRLENVDYLKEAAGDMLQFRRIQAACRKSFHMLVGCDALAYELLCNGASGWISITANALVSQSQSIFDNMAAGKRDLAWEIYRRCLPVYSVCEGSYKAIQTIKYIMDRMGLCGGLSRLPRLELTAPEKAGIDELLRKSEIL